MFIKQISFVAKVILMCAAFFIADSVFNACNISVVCAAATGQAKVEAVKPTIKKLVKKKSFTFKKNLYIYGASCGALPTDTRVGAVHAPEEDVH